MSLFSFLFSTVFFLNRIFSINMKIHTKKSLLERAILLSWVRFRIKLGIGILGLGFWNLVGHNNYLAISNSQVFAPFYQLKQS